jgi:signal peptidase II
MSEPKRRGWFSLNAGASNWLWLALAVLALDQWTKRLITLRFELLEERALLPVLSLKLLHNEGAAFSLLAGAGGWQRWFFISLALVISIAILIWLRRLPASGQHRVAAGMALIMGGALGNVADRIRLGYVVDFILVHYNDWYFPAFNIADSAITIGAGLLILDGVIDYGRKGDKAG